MQDEIIVRQKTGHPSTVTVRKEDTTDFMHHPVSTLYFTSDQYLDTDSARAWECNKAIEEYCIERGYRVPRKPTGRNTTQAVYGARFHSSILTSKLQKEIKSDPRFTHTAEQAQTQAASINRKYAPIIARIKHLAFVLGEAQDAELDKARDAIKAMSSQIASEMDIPVEVSERDRDQRLFNPLHPIPIVGLECQRLHSKKLPDLSEVAALMSELESF